MLEIGASAPEFTLTDQDGKQVDLRDFRGKKNVVLFFYPRDNTPICTAESCMFRDRYEDITKTGAVVLGVSADPDDSHRDFAEKHSLPFPLLSDEDRATAKAYGVKAGLGLLPGRMTFIIDRDGKIRHITNARFGAKVHVTEALQALESLGG